MMKQDPTFGLDDFHVNYQVHHHHLLGRGWSYRFQHRHPRHALHRSDGVVASFAFLTQSTIRGPRRRLYVQIHLLPEALVQLNLPWPFVKRFAQRLRRDLDPSTTPREAARVLRDELLPAYEPLHRKILARLQRRQILAYRDGAVAAAAEHTDEPA